MPTIYVPAWELFDRTFKAGDDVIVVTEDDEYAWGKLQYVTSEGADLWRGSKHTHILWNDLRFMSHDGFPIRKLKGADGRTTIINGPSQRNRIITHLRNSGLTELVFADPFHIEGIEKATLYNEGNEDPAYFRTGNEEVLEMIAPDGAVAHLWSLGTVWYVGASAGLLYTTKGKKWV